jgi:acyl-coenzyme A synthetase/AMP-(fatty) acid ligase
MSPSLGENRIWIDSEVLTWQDVFQAATRKHPGIGRTDPPRACVVQSAMEALEWVILGLTHGLDLAILGRERFSENVSSTLAEAGIGIDGCLTTKGADSDQGCVWILTSGSTGAPKLIQHTWGTLLTAKRPPAPHRWLLPFQIGTYAWYQIVMPTIHFAGQELVIPPAGSDVAGILARGRECGADAISSTPTFWRVALMSMTENDLAKLPFTQITLGGEIVDQAILDELRALFPSARITHIYAATEVGACIVVNDGMEGFPAAFLQNPDSAIQLAERDGILWVHSPKRGLNQGIADEDGWICTGDRIERSVNRVRFLGRAGRQLINVGGQKAYPAEIEAALLSHPAVRWCRVAQRRAPLVGNLVSAEVVLSSNISTEAAEKSLVEHCRTRLPEYAVPRFFRFIDSIRFGGNLKSSP